MVEAQRRWGGMAQVVVGKPCPSSLRKTNTMKNAHSLHARHERGQTQQVQLTYQEDALQSDAADVSPIPESYSQDDLAQLLYMIEEEKLAGDVYEALYAQTGMQVFDRIAASENRHFDALLTQAQTLGLAVDGILALPEGQYISPQLQSLYDDLMLAASTSAVAALEVGVAIETTDMVDLQAASANLDGTALGDVYANLLTGSAQHLSAFENLLA